MPPARVDPDRLRVLGAALGPLRDCAREGAEGVLSQFPDVGDRETQTVLDGWVDQLADLLREVEATATDLAGRLRVAALSRHDSDSDSDHDHGSNVPTALDSTGRGAVADRARP